MRRASFLFLLGFVLLSCQSVRAGEYCSMHLFERVNMPDANLLYPSPVQARKYGLIGSSYMHIRIVGHVEIEALVTERGEVTDLKIVESVAHPFNSSWYPEGDFTGFFDKGVLDYASKWKFEPRENPCTLKYIFRIGN